MNPDAKAIRLHSLTSPEAMFNTLAFAVATANCPFGQSLTTIRKIREWGGDIMHKVYSEMTLEDKSGMGCGLTGMKFASYQYLYANRADIYKKYLECNAVDNGHLIFWEYCMDCLCGMGMVKSAFAVQMLFNRLGCIDIHNARELGYSKCPTGKARKNRPIYLNIQAVKTSEAWWNDWCALLAKKYPGQFDSAEQVSRLHSLAVNGF